MHITYFLLNPPMKNSSTVTERNVELMTTLLEFDSYAIQNLVSIPSRDLPELNSIGSESRIWLRSRPAIAKALGESDSLFAAWSLGGFANGTRHNFNNQIDWLVNEAMSFGHEFAWTVDGRPRHPSRWRQHVGPMKARFPGESLEARLTASLLSIPIKTLSA